jgi:hypothetical protein
MNKESKINLNASNYAISHCDSDKTYNGLEVHKMLYDAYIAGNLEDNLEDKDEKIRKALINVFATHKDYEIFFGVSVENILAWLEKQGETNIQNIKPFKIESDKFYFCIKDYFAGGCYRSKKGDIVLAQNGMNMMGLSLKEASEYFIPINPFNEYVVAWLEKRSQQKEINLAEILKHYPRETELYSPLYGKLWLAEVDEEFGIITCYKHPLDEGCTRAILKQEDTVSFYSDGTTGLPDFSVSDECMLFLYDSEKQGEQKTFNYESANIQQKDFAYVEPKFRIEAKKWYICISQYGNCIEGRWYQALSDGRITDDFGTEYDMHSNADKYFRPWNIKDVKDGNVLYSPGHNLLWIYKDKDTYHVATNLNYPNNVSIGGDIVMPSDVCS